MQVYISHSAEDKDLVRRLAQQLELAGFDVFNQEDIDPGENWAAKVAKAIQSSRAMVVVFTEAAARSPWVQRDIEYALASLRYKNRLVTVVVDKSAEIPWILKRLPIIEVRRNNIADAGRRVVEELRGVAAT